MARAPLLWAVGLVLAVVLVYGNSLDNAFHYDDTHSIVENTALRSLENIPAFFADPSTFSREESMAMYRPLLQSSFALNYALDEYRPRLYRLVNILLHGGSAVAVFLLLGRLSRHWGWAWWAGLLYGVHPIHSQAVNYISSRSEIAAGLGVLVALYLVLFGRRPLWAWVAYAAALLCKSAAVALLPLVGLAEWTRRRGWKAWIGAVWPVAALTGAYLLLIALNGFLPRSMEQEVRPWAAQWMTQVKAQVYYLWLAAMPVRLSVEHNLQDARQLDWAVVAAGALLATLGWLAWKGRNRLDGRALWWVGATAALPFLWPLNVVVNEHRLYLPLVGGLLVLAPAAGQVRRPLVLGAWGLIACMAVLTWQRSTVWRDGHSLWLDAVAKAPGSFRAQSNAGLALYEAGELDAAHQALQRALVLNPRYAKTWNNLGLVHEDAGRGQEAEAAYLRATQIDPALPGLYVNRARLRLEQGKTKEALLLLEQAIARDSLYATAWVSRGRALQAGGKGHEAVAAYRRAVEIEPYWAVAHNNLAMALLETGQHAGVMPHLIRAVELDPDFVEARINLHLAQARIGGYPLPLAYQELVFNFPERTELYGAWARSLETEGKWARAAEAWKKGAEAGGRGMWRGAGAAALKAGKGDAAVEAFRRALDQEPGAALLYHNLAAALAATGRMQEAQDAVARAVEMAPDEPRYRALMARLAAAAAGEGNDSANER